MRMVAASSRLAAERLTTQSCIIIWYHYLLYTFTLYYYTLFCRNSSTVDNAAVTIVIPTTDYSIPATVYT